MFEAVKRIRRIVDKRHERGHLPYRVQDIHAAVIEVTGIDCVRFYGFPDDGTNPVWGRFRRYSGEIAPYAGNGCIVEIDYNQSLEARPWDLRFTATKELCHALEDDPTVRVKSCPELEQLVKALQADHTSQVSAIYPPLQSESIAEVCALELLCPLRDRLKLVGNGARAGLSDMQIAQAFVIPVGLVPFLFEPAVNTFMATIFGDG